MSGLPSDEESPEFTALREAGRELGASFLPITKEQGVVVRAMLRAASDRSREPRISARS